jgi:hypothetical protein
MANRRLNPNELKKANLLLDYIREKIKELADSDKELVFAYRRKIFKELIYDERSTPAERKRLKKLKYETQNGLCEICRNQLPEKYTVLDRFQAINGYVPENTRLICQDCDTKEQSKKSYS